MAYHRVWYPHIEYERLTANIAHPIPFEQWLVEELDHLMTEELMTLAAVDGAKYILRPRGTG